MIDTFLVTHPRKAKPLQAELNRVHDDGTISVIPLASITDLSEFQAWCDENGIIIDPHPGGTILGLDVPDDETAFHLHLRWA